MTAGQIPVAATASTVTSSKALQGTDASLLTSGTVSGTGVNLCTDSNGGATTTSCSNGTVTNLTITTANGVSGSVATSTTTPAITLTLGAITPTSVAATGALSGASLSATGATPGGVSLTAGTGSIPSLAANSAGFAAPTSGGTAYLFKLPATISAGILHAAAPATADGVTESAVTSSAVSLTADVSGLLPTANGGTNLNTSSSTGVAQVASGTWSVSTALPSATTATTQSACNNSTSVATTAYVGTVCNTVETSGSPLSATAQSQTIWNNTASAYVVNLPTPTASGPQICLGNYRAQASAISLVPGSGVTIYYKGVAGTAGSSTGIKSAGAVGDFICLEATDSTTYEAIGAGQGTWTNN